MAIGSLPHRSVADAIALSQTATDIVTIPTLPRRSPAESMIAQALVGISGVTVGQYGSIAVDSASIDTTLVRRCAPTSITTRSAGSGLSQRDAARRSAGPVKWQFVGPITLGLALQRAGVPTDEAFDVAMRAVRAHTTNLLDAVADGVARTTTRSWCSTSPSSVSCSSPGFPLAPDDASICCPARSPIIEAVAVAGVHCCGDADWASLMAVGARPAVGAGRTGR